MTVPEALRDPVLRRFPLRRHRLSVAGGTLSIVAPRSPTRMLVSGQIKSCGTEPIYWAEVWPASVAVARYLLRGPALSGLRVLDLGCGMGVAGTAAGVAGAEIVFADRSADALCFARFNALHNGVAEVETEQLDWATKTHAARVDLLLLCDVSYQRSHHLPLLRHVATCLARGGRVLHADPGREGSTNFLDLASREYSLRTLAEDTHFEGRRSHVRIVWIEPALAHVCRPD